MTCDASLLARYADDPGGLRPEERAAVDAHLAGCAACRAAVEEQRDTAAILRSRAGSTPRPGFAARVSARLDAGDEGPGLLELANWRAWTAALAPVAAALLLAALLSGGASPAAPAGGPRDAATLVEWPTTAMASSDASAFLQSAGTGDALIEAVLTGVPATSGGHDGR